MTASSPLAPLQLFPHCDSDILVIFLVGPLQKNGSHVVKDPRTLPILRQLYPQQTTVQPKQTN